MYVEEAWAAGVADAAAALWGVKPSGDLVEPPSDPRFGDAVCNLPMRLARELKKSPRAIAEELARAIEKAGLPYLAGVEVAGAGFVNLRGTPELYQDELRRIHAEGVQYGRSAAGKGLKVLVEHCSANPTGPLHVAHGRQAAVGDSLANILDFAGYRVSREFYVNDTGQQIVNLGKSILWRLSGAAEPPDENCYRGEYVRELAEEIRAGGGKADVEGAGRFGKDRLLAEIRRDLEAFRVRYDHWASQEELERGGQVEALLKFYADKGVSYEKDGALWLKSKDLGDTDDKVLIKSDRSYAYRTADLAYHRGKFDRGFDVLVDLWGPDHHAHIATMQAGLRALGFDLAPLKELAAGNRAFEVVTIQHCRLLRGGQELKMSKRAASYVTLRELMDEVGVDAARFFLVMRRTDSHLDFDLEVAKKKSLENPVYYAQYAHARICSIVRKGVGEGMVDAADVRDGVWSGRVDAGGGLGPDEVALIRVLRRFSREVERSARDLQPAVMADYLKDLSGAYQRYYELGNRDVARRVLVAEEGVRRARLAVGAAVQIVLRNGFRLLGISAPEEM